MNLLELIISIFAPHECIVCGSDNGLLCSRCIGRLKSVPERCHICRVPSPGGTVCLACQSLTYLQSVRVATEYSGAAKDLIWLLKMSGTRSSAAILAKLMKELVDTNLPTLLVAVPTATSRVRQRGYDQANLITRQLSKQTGLKHANVLARSGQMHQHGLSRKQRLNQLQGSYRVTKLAEVRGKHITLVDDVITTGATLDAAAKVLYVAGASSVHALVFAQPHFNTNILDGKA